MQKKNEGNALNSLDIYTLYTFWLMYAYNCVVVVIHEIIIFFWDSKLYNEKNLS